MEVYKTVDMEVAIREMAARNHSFVVYRSYFNVKPIRLRQNRIKDIPFTMISAWSKDFNKEYEAWKRKGGMLIYNYKYGKNHTPIEAEAALFVECPGQYVDFMEMASEIKREVVIYRPPTWYLHELNLDYRYPNSNYHYSLMTVIHALMGRKLNDRLSAAFELSGFTDFYRTAVFEAEEIEALLGIDDRQLRVLLMSYGFRGSYIRYHVYTPRLTPRNENMRWAYDLLCGAPDSYKGQRYLRFDTLPQGRIIGFNKFLKQCIRKKYVKRERKIYVLKTGYRPLDYPVIDAVANARRGEWFRVSNLVDRSPEYPIVLSLQTQSEPSESEPT